MLQIKLSCAIQYTLKVAALREWMKSEAAIHTMRDHPKVMNYFAQLMKIFSWQIDSHHLHSLEKETLRMIFLQHGTWPMMAGMWGARLSGRDAGEPLHFAQFGF